MSESFLGGKAELHCADCLEVLKTLPDNSIDSCVTDPPYLLTSINKRFGGDGLASAQFGADGRFSRLSGGFMNKKWDAPTDAMGVSVFEAWLAGFIAGEGCFRIQSHKEGTYYTCQFSIHLRQDDAAILIACQKRIGGRIVFNDERENRQGVKSKPDVRWFVETRDDCLALANILDRIPLFAKKAKDYELWRRGLDLWINTPKGSRWHGPRDVSEMASLHKRLQEVKRWDGISEIDLNFDPFMRPDQAFHYRWAREVYRVLKPGAHLLAFGGTRTYHRMACAIEDAGFEIRDQIQWLYGSGFPKSHDVSKGIDRAAGAERNTAYEPNNSNAVYGKGMGGGEWNAPSDPPFSDAARQWEGWGTALKPANEPICLARKPLSEATVAANVLKWGTGAINVDGCRVAAVDQDELTASREQFGKSDIHTKTNIEGRFLASQKIVPNMTPGRWPANVIHDGSEQVVAWFPETTSGLLAPHHKDGGKTENIFGKYAGRGINQDFGNDTGSAARFFYTAKADSNDRLGSKHPTVKPLDLMQYLVRLVTPKGGVVLDMFAGTGTTGEAAWREGCKAVLIEREAEYQTDIRRRMELALAGPDERAYKAIKARQGDKPQDHGPLFA